MRILPDDPRLTAYALGELEPAERAAIEAALSESPEARAELEEIRSAAALLSDELRSETAPALTESQRAAIVAGRNGQATFAPKLNRASRLFIGFASLAACLVAAVGLTWQKRPLDLKEWETSFKAAKQVPPLPPVAANHTNREVIQATHDGDQTSPSPSQAQVANNERRTAERLPMPPPMIPTGASDGNATSFDGLSAESIQNGHGYQSIPATGTADKPDSPMSHTLDSPPVAPLPHNLSDALSRITAEQRAALSRGEAITLAYELATNGNGLGGGGGISGTDSPVFSTARQYQVAARGLRDTGDVSSPQPAPPQTAARSMPLEPSTENEAPARALAEVDSGEQTVSRLAATPARSSPSATSALGMTPAQRQSLVDQLAAMEGLKTELQMAKFGRMQTYDSLSKMKPDDLPVTAEMQKMIDADSRVLDLRARIQSARDYHDQLATRYGSNNAETTNAANAVQTLNDRLSAARTALLSDIRNQMIATAQNDLAQAQDQESRLGERIAVLKEQCRAPQNQESYRSITDNQFLRVTDSPLSTFSIDVDTASYANTRRFINSGRLPPADAVRIEEMVNYFTYDYPQPGGDAPFSVNAEMAECPWASRHRLLRIGLRGRSIAQDRQPATNLVFLIDVSGSMQPENKLPLLQKSLSMLVRKLNANDRVAIVVYAGASGLVLPSTTGDRQDTILAAIDRLNAGGSTNGAAGIQLAYETARANFIQGGANRVILATDGDFNVGITSEGDLARLIEEQAKSGIFLSVLGFGMDNLKDSTLETLADKGNGNYAYIDTPREARKALVEQLAGTLFTIAKDVKIQIEFNPAKVGAYRLIGYENRILAAQDFNDDRKDAGEIGAGHTVTALYEIVPVGESINAPGIDPLKYQQPQAVAVAPGGAVNASNETCTVKLRYKQPDGQTSRLLEVPVIDLGNKFATASGDFKFAAAVAGFGMQLRQSPFKGDWTLAAVQEVAQESRGNDITEYRTEFIDLVKKARGLMGQ